MIMRKGRLVFAMLTKLVEEDKFDQAVEMKKKYQLSEPYVNCPYLCGADLYPLRPTDSREHIRTVLRQVNGVMLPGGMGNVVKPNPDPAHASEMVISRYTEAVRIIMEEAIQLNREGVYFPVFGICLGFEAMVAVAAEDINIVEKREGALNYCTRLMFTEAATQSRWLASLSAETVESLKTKDITYNYHSYSVDKEKCLANPKFCSLYNIVSTSWSKDNSFEFVSMIEGKEMPFYGIQFHVETLGKMYFPPELIVMPTMRTYTTACYELVMFVVREAKKNAAQLLPENESLLIINNPGVVVTVKNLGIKCYLWD